jgi:tRNA threonylcarbamoyladenosine biosynthesis protein TsaB
MIFFLALQSTYNTVELALFADSTLIDTASISKLEASSGLLPTLTKLLSTNKKTLEDLSFIAVNQGPGPFTTLRVVITTINGLQFATQIPLIGVAGFDAFLQEHVDTQHPQTVVLFNAFSHDVYCAWRNPITQEIEQQCLGIDQALQAVQKQFPTNTIRFLGNAVNMHKKEIIEQFTDRLYIPTPLATYPSIEAIALQGLQKWQEKDHKLEPIMPIYLKKTTSYITVPKK